MPPINLKLSKKLFNDVYLPHLTDYKKRYETYYGGAGSGKSVFISQKLIVKACKSARKVLVIRKFGTTLNDSVFQLIKDQLSKWKLLEHCKVNLSTYTITLPNGSMFLFKGLDDSEKIKSITDITDIWVEESTEITEDDFTQLDLRLRALAGDLQLICSFNPVSKANWVYKKWFDPKATYDEEVTMILKTTYKDNRFLPAEYIKALEEKMYSNPLYYKIYALGEFAVAEGLVITNWEKKNFNALELAELLDHRTGMDLGFTDPSAVVDSLYDKDNKIIYVFNEFYKRGCQLSELAEAIFDMGLRKSKIMVDAAEPRSREYFRNKGINAVPCIKGADSVKAGLMFLQDHKIIVHERNCPNFIMELENFSYIKSKKTGEWTDDTTHEFSHAIDALRYAYSDIYTNKKAKTLSKSALGL
jgi:phage terminase large subunit